jgi:hypothetical protein
MFYFFQITLNGGSQWQPGIPGLFQKLQMLKFPKTSQNGAALAVQCTAWLGIKI